MTKENEIGLVSMIIFGVATGMLCFGLALAGEMRNNPELAHKVAQFFNSVRALWPIG